MTIGPNCENGTEGCERQNGHFGRESRTNIRNFRKTVFQARDGEIGIRSPGNLRRQIDAPIRIGGEVLDGIGEDFVIATNVRTLSGVSNVVTKSPSS